MKTLACTAVWRFASALCYLGLAALLDAQVGPHFEGFQRLTNQEVVFKLIAPTGVSCRIDASTNLPQWAGFLTLQSSGTNQHTDTAAPYLYQRFYRAEQLGTSNVLTGDHLVTTNGEVVIHPINHATLVLAWNGRMIYVDPVGGAAPFAGLPKADLVFITHDHSDHFHTNTLHAVVGTNVVILAPQAVFSAMYAPLKALTTVLTNGASANVLDLHVDAVPAYNLTTSNHPRGRGNGYVLTIGGRRVYVAGDTEDTPEMRALRGIDLAFVCMNIPYTMSVDKAASAVREFRPKVVYPYHYRNADSSYADLNSFKRQVGADLGIEVRFRKWY